MAKKMDQLIADLNEQLNKLEGSIDDKVAGAVAFTVRARMLDFISKGISPILGSGRFPAYLGASRARSNKRDQRAIRSLLRNKSSRNLAQLKRKQAQLNNKASQLKRAYPFSVQSKYPSKKPNPVNLFLSGEFLSNLSYKLGIRGKRKTIELGFFDELSAKKEQGHREGANGQPKRPIIPKGGESFAETIKLDIMKLLKDAVKRAFDK